MYQYIATRLLGVTSHNTAFFITDRKRKNSHTFHLYQRLYMEKKGGGGGSGKSENLESFTLIDLKFSKFPMLNIPTNSGQTQIQHPLL